MKAKHLLEVGDWRPCAPRRLPYSHGTLQEDGTFLCDPASSAASHKGG